MLVALESNLKVAEKMKGGSKDPTTQCGVRWGEAGRLRKPETHDRNDKQSLVSDKRMVSKELTQSSTLE